MANGNAATLLIEDDADDYVQGDKAKKFQLWMSYISALTSRIEIACQRKTKVRVKMKLCPDPNVLTF